MGLLHRLRGLLGRGKDNDEMSDAAFMGSPAGAGIGHHHAGTDVLPPDDRGAQGGPPSHEDPLEPQAR